MRNPNREVFKCYGKRTAECYNHFFNPNICHVCKSVDRGNLILCDQCCLISYCSEKHKKIHQREHVAICAIIAKVLKVKPQRDTRRYSDWQQWIQSRKETMNLIQEEWGRPVDAYVNQVIMWSKSCVVCHQQAELRVCQRCFSVNYCNEHSEAFNKKHDGAKCDQFMLFLNINIENMSGDLTNFSYKFLPFVNANSHFEEMLEFCMEHILMPRKDLDWIAEDYVLSDYLSRPLTIYSGFKRTNFLNVLQENDLVIHLISTDFVDKNGAAAWEILLHLLPEVLQLIIVWIDPGLTYHSKRYELCYLCKRKEKSLHCITISMIYYKFVNSFRSNTSPHVVVGFHGKVSKNNTWLKSIKIIEACSCPLLLSFSHEEEAQRSIIEIQQVLGTNIEPIFNKRNHFGSLAPYRNLESNDIYFRNEYLLIYDTLHWSDPDQSNTSSCE